MWNPREVRKLLAQIAGFLFGLGGIVLMITDVRATGKINISSNLISGEIESGSAGLLLIFFAFFLIIIPSMASKSNQATEPNKAMDKTSVSLKLLHKMLISDMICGILSITCFLISNSEKLKDNHSFTNLLVIGGYGFGALFGLLALAAMFEFFEQSENNQEKKV